MRILVLISGLLLSISASATSQLKLDLMLAKRGDVSAQYSVATAYEFGTDAKKDLKESFAWYLKAAKQSHAPSQYKVGLFFEKGMGTAKNIDSAMIWYKKAKANGSNQASKRLNKTAYVKSEKEKKARRLALQAKLDKQEKVRKATDKASKDKMLAKKRAAEKKKSQKSSKNNAVKKVVKSKSAAVKIPDIMKVVLNNKWKNSHGTADYLPSGSTTCLESGDKELTCFSSEKSRKIKSSNVTYTAKSTIAGFKSNGSFKVFYNYNGISVAGAKTKASDVYGLNIKSGWQEPAIAVKCQASDRKNITCYRGNKKVSFNR